MSRAGASPPVTPMPLRMVALNMTGMAPAYSGCLQKGHMKGQSVRSSLAGTTEALQQQQQQHHHQLPPHHHWQLLGAALALHAWTLDVGTQMAENHG
jgi:hypothetical protein